MLTLCDNVAQRESHPSLVQGVSDPVHRHGRRSDAVQVRGGTRSRLVRQDDDAGRRQTNIVSFVKVPRQGLPTESGISAETSPCSMGEVRWEQASKWGRDPVPPTE